MRPVAKREGPLERDVRRREASRLTIVEIFSGSGRLSLTAKEFGCRVDPVDHRGNRHNQHVRATSLDLSQPCAMEELIALLRRHREQVHEEGGGLHVHFAPPCGTCSRAREVPLPRGQRGPVPLRSARHPAGLPTLTGTDRDKVAAESSLYDLVSNVITQHLANCRQPRGRSRTRPTRGCGGWRPSPSCSTWRRSWTLTSRRATTAAHATRRRASAATFPASPAWLGRALDSTRHAGKTNMESNGYIDRGGSPTRGSPLPRRQNTLATCAWRSCKPSSSTTARQPRPTWPLQRARARPLWLCRQLRLPRPGVQMSPGKRAPGVGRQARGLVRIQLVDEYKLIVDINVYTLDERRALRSWILAPSRRLQNETNFQSYAVPATAKLLAVAGREIRGRGGASSGASAEEALALVKQGKYRQARVGIPWTEEEFLRKAAEVEHPFREGYGLRPRTAKAIHRLLTRGPIYAKERRERLLERWTRRRDELEEQEKALHKELDPQVEAVVAEKKILLFREKLGWAGFVDKEAYRMLAAGFPIVGDIQDSCEFPAMLKVAESSVRELLAQSRAARAAARIATRASGDEELDREVIRVTKEEMSKGWMRGPFTEEQLNEKYGLWTAARRFGLRQGGAAGKVRPVDDFSEYDQNGTLTTPFKVDLGGVDEVAALARSLHSSTRVGKVRVRDEDGEERLGCLHPGWKGSPGLIKGAAADLAQAFRQLARLPAHAGFSIVSVFNPEKGQEFY